MRNILSFFIIFCINITFLQATTTTYTFISKNWDSEVGLIKTDQKTDGWKCDIAAYEYYSGYTDGAGRIYSKGVSVKTSTPNAGATSILSFENVRQICFNYCQNSSKGSGIIHIQIGENEPMEIAIVKPEISGEGVYMKDAIFNLNQLQSGIIRFWIECTQNAININTITIRADNGSGNNDFIAESTYTLVRDINELGDSSQIIIGVMDYTNKPEKIMGFYDETISKNNIHAIKGKYENENREIVKEDENAVYTLIKKEDYFLIVDNIRYDEAYLVASGGTPNNYLTLWDSPESWSYGDYGHWDIQIDIDGTATIQSLGVSLSNLIQYNATHDLFSCYQQASQTPICIYKKTANVAIDSPTIFANVLSFGDIVINQDTMIGSKMMTIYAQKLTEDITLSLKNGTAISLETNKIDRDGDKVEISYKVIEPGFYIDTLCCQSGETSFEVAIMLRAYPQHTVNEVVTLDYLQKCYLKDVVITKKYDKWVFVKDSTGSMLLYDNKIYAQGCKTGDVLSGVMGRYNNYYGVPEIELASSFSVKQNIDCQAESVERIDSADVCRFIHLKDAIIDGYIIHFNGQSLPIYDLFNYCSTYSTELLYTIDAIVYINHDVLSLCPVTITAQAKSGVENIVLSEKSAMRYTILGQKIDSSYRGIIVEKGKKYLEK